MESTALASEYLLNRSSLESLVSYEKFKLEVRAETNIKFSSRLLRKIYNELKSQRHQTLQSIKKTIDDQLDIPMEPLVGLVQADYSISSNSIQNLNKSLNKLKTEVEVEIPPVSKDIESTIASIDRLLEILDEYKTQELVNPDIIMEVNQELIKLKSYFDIDIDLGLES